MGLPLPAAVQEADKIDSSRAIIPSVIHRASLLGCCGAHAHPHAMRGAATSGGQV